MEIPQKMHSNKYIMLLIAIQNRYGLKFKFLYSDKGPSLLYIDTLFIKCIAIWRKNKSKKNGQICQYH